ncbi:hypothetical protein L7F22_062646 [Adiantum nelumboides]|nr:hypothetical protein [Adiantum nelumboides]
MALQTAHQQALLDCPAFDIVLDANADAFQLQPALAVEDHKWTTPSASTRPCCDGNIDPSQFGTSAIWRPPSNSGDSHILPACSEPSWCTPCYESSYVDTKLECRGVWHPPPILISGTQSTSTASSNTAASWCNDDQLCHSERGRPSACEVDRPAVTVAGCTIQHNQSHAHLRRRLQGISNASASFNFTPSACSYSFKELVFLAAALQPVPSREELNASKLAEPQPPCQRRVPRSDASKMPQSVAARRRRARIRERLKALQQLVPGGASLDTASMLDEAACYISFLQGEVEAMNQGSSRLLSMC